MNTFDQLAAIPEMAADVFVAWGAQYRPQEETTGKPVPGPRVPVDLDAFDALRPDEHGLLFELSQAVRATLEEARRAGDFDLEAADTPTWVTETEWLFREQRRWLDDDYLAEYVPNQIRAVYHALAQVLRQPKPTRHLCRECGEQLVKDAGALVCCGCAKIYHAADVVHLVEQENPLPTGPLVGLREAARLVGRPVATLHRWASSGLLTDHGGKYDLERVEYVASIVRQGVKTRIAAM